MRARKRNSMYQKVEDDKVDLSKETKNGPIKVSQFRRSLYTLCAALLFTFILFPTFFYSSSTLRRHLLFMNYLDFNSEVNYSNPETLELKCSRNLYLSSENGVVLGVWHIIPNSLKERKCGKDRLDAINEFDDDRPIILYLHGSGGNRGSKHRVAMYKVLSETSLDAHVVTLDYRGFGDSTNLPITVDDFVTDAEMIYKWLAQNVSTSRIYIWGHSLGAGVTLRLVSTKSTVHPRGLIMEAPFANSPAAMKDFPATLPFRYMPFFNKMFVEPMKGADINFDNTVFIANVTFPVLILHAKDDIQVPWYQPELLYQIALKNGNVNVKYIEYEHSFGYGHIHISNDPDLPNKIASFMRSSESFVPNI